MISYIETETGTRGIFRNGARTADLLGHLACLGTSGVSSDRYICVALKRVLLVARDSYRYLYDSYVPGT